MSGSSLDLAASPVELTATLVDISSVSHDEGPIADAVEGVLRQQGQLEVVRLGNCVLARTNQGKSQRVILAGHLDTVPIADNIPSRIVHDPTLGSLIYGCGSSDMKSGDAVILHLAATIVDSPYDLTFIFYDCEEIDSRYNGLGQIHKDMPEWLHGDLAILGEPTAGFIEAGCQGTLRVRVTATGTRAHSARSWLGDNAIHKFGNLLSTLQCYEARSVDIDGCVYREGLSAVGISGGLAGNIIPDEAFVDINFRFAPDRSPQQAFDHVQEVIASAVRRDDLTVSLIDSAAGALPGLTHPAAQALLAAAGGKFRAKYGWTDVARFSALGIPAVNFGPGDPGLAHTQQEYVQVAHIVYVADVLKKFLST